MRGECSNSAILTLGRFALEDLPEPVIVLDYDNNVVQANRAASKRREELTQLIDPSRADGVSAFMDELRHTGRATAEVHLSRRDRSPTYLRLEGFAVEAFRVVRMSDVSAERAREEELRQLRRVESLSLLAASVIHDFNNLFTPMLCLSSMLNSELEAGTRAAMLAMEIEAAAVRATSLLRDLLSVARPGSSSVEVVNINWVISGLRPLLERVLGDAVALSLRLSERLPPVMVDRARFEHALLNIIANARNAMPDGGELIITTSTESRAPFPSADGDTNAFPWVSLTVTDTGVGMSEAVKASAFDRFFTTRQATGGTGLGLASVKRFAEESGGHAQLCSQLGKGTSVSLHLPSVEPSALPRPTQPPEKELDCGTETVLVVERDPQVRQTVAMVLSDRGYRVIAAGSMERALELRLSGIDLVLLEAALSLAKPRLFDELRREAVNVLLMTSGAEQGALSKPSGAPRLLEKAFSDEELLQAVRRALDESTDKN